MKPIRTIQPIDLAWAILAHRSGYVILGNAGGELVQLRAADWQAQVPAEAIPLWALTPRVHHVSVLPSSMEYNLPYLERSAVDRLVGGTEHIALKRYAQGFTAGFGPQTNTWVVYDHPEATL